MKVVVGMNKTALEEAYFFVCVSKKNVIPVIFQVIPSNTFFMNFVKMSRKIT